MAKFNELNQQDKIQHIKDGFVLILETLAQDPNKLKEYIPTTEEPKYVVASFEKIADNANDETRMQIAARNNELKTKVDAENEKLRAAFNEKNATYQKVLGIVSNLKKKAGCLCGSCIDINITNTTIPTELEVLIDAARREAEARDY